MAGNSPTRLKSNHARIAEHTKYRRQCGVRVKSGLKVCFVAGTLVILLCAYAQNAWPSALFIFAVPLVLTIFEALGYLKHRRALRHLTHGA